MNILILGSGGREHALAWKVKQSKKCKKLLVLPGNSGTASIAINIDCNILDFENIKKVVIENAIDMMIVGPEDPLVAGIYDEFKNDILFKNLQIIGPSKKGAALEGSKDFAKKFMQLNNIPTAKYKTFTKESLQSGFEFLETLAPPFVLKADCLSAGNGVLIINNLQESKM